jgi:hypothetical protein
LDDASRAGVKVDVVQLPMHAICLERFAACNRWPLYEAWVSTLTRIVAQHNQRFPASPAVFWDFCTYNAVTTSLTFASDRWFSDPFHFKVELGNLALDRIMHVPSPPRTQLDNFGLVVTEGNLPAHLARLRRDHQAYYDANPVIRRVHERIRTYVAGQSPPEG